METKILSIPIRSEEDVVTVRRNARRIAELLGFDERDQTRISTAVSEIARNAFTYGMGGNAGFSLDEADGAPILSIVISDNGPGIENLRKILSGTYRSSTGMGMGIVGARRLMDDFTIQSEPGGGTVVTMRKRVKGGNETRGAAARIARELTEPTPPNIQQELRQQNHELFLALEELGRRQDELSRLNTELEDTNRGVVALYAELDEKAERLRRADELKSRFLSNMSHEFRTPLNSILALSRLLLDRLDGDLTEEQERQITYIRKAASDLFDLVNDLLDLAKVEAGKIDVHPSEWTIADLFGALRGMFRPLLTKEKVALLFDRSEELRRMHTDEAKVAQILRNFISNALKFTEHGEVRVSAEISEDGQDITFSVSDTGIGIAPEHREKVFDEFTQIDSARQRLVKGTGLGLPLSRRLAELLGGSVGLTSEPGKGSTFRARIPRLYRTQQEEAEAEPETPAPIAAGTLLVVDDLEVHRYVIRQFLANSGITVVETGSSREGLRLIRETLPSAVCLDVVMPELNGIELLESLRNDPATSGIPAVVVTSKLLTDHERTRITALGAAILSKEGLTRENFLNTLNLALLDRLTVPRPDEM